MDTLVNVKLPRGSKRCHERKRCFCESLQIAYLILKCRSVCALHKQKLWCNGDCHNGGQVFVLIPLGSKKVGHSLCTVIGVQVPYMLSFNVHEHYEVTSQLSPHIWTEHQADQSTLTIEVRWCAKNFILSVILTTRRMYLYNWFMPTSHLEAVLWLI